MADIVRLEENGVAKYIETHVNAVAGLDDFIKKLKDYKVVFNGASLLNGSQSFSWAAADLTDELVLILSQYDDTKGEAMDAMFTVETIPKAYLSLFGGKNYRLNLWDGRTKVIYPGLTSVSGHDVNGQGTNRTFVVRAILVK